MSRNNDEEHTRVTWFRNDFMIEFLQLRRLELHCFAVSLVLYAMDDSKSNHPANSIITIVLVIPCNTPRMHCFQAELIFDCCTRVTTSQAPEVLMFSVEIASVGGTYPVDWWWWGLPSRFSRIFMNWLNTCNWTDHEQINNISQGSIKKGHLKVHYIELRLLIGTDITFMTRSSFTVNGLEASFSTSKVVGFTCLDLFWSRNELEPHQYRQVQLAAMPTWLLNPWAHTPQAGDVCPARWPLLSSGCRSQPKGTAIRWWQLPMGS